MQSYKSIDNYSAINLGKDSRSEVSLSEASMLYHVIEEKYARRWFDRSEGWDGSTYADAIRFCATKDSYIPCPYEACKFVQKEPLVCLDMVDNSRCISLIIYCRLPAGRG